MGCADILGRIVEDLKDESEPYRRMVMETIDKVVSDLGTADVDARLEELLIDGILYAFQEQVRSEEDALCCLVCRVFNVSMGVECQTPCLMLPQRMPSVDMLSQHCRKTDHRLNTGQESCAIMATCCAAVRSNAHTVGYPIGLVVIGVERSWWLCRSATTPM